MCHDPEHQWFYGYFDDVDTMQIEKIAAWLDDDVIVRFGNEPILHSKSAALAAIAGLWGNFKALSHAHGKVIGTYFCDEGAVTFALADDRKITIPGITILGRRNGLVTKLSGYLDFVQLYAPTDAAIEVIQPGFFLAPA